MRVKCVKAYYDLKLKKTINAGDEFEVDEARAKELSSVNNKAGSVLVEIITTTTTTTTTDKVAKGKPRKKANE